MTGLRVNVNEIKRRLKVLGVKVQASEFRPEVERFAAKVMATCIEETPVRSEGVISKNQHRQYQLRINYVPSVHDTTSDPRCIWKPNGQIWLFSNGRWHRPDLGYHLPDEVQSDFTRLSAVREQRMKRIEEDAFVDWRAQARFLYQRTWWQIAESIGVALAASSEIISSYTRTRKPKHAPPKARGQWRGGKEKLSIAVFNPLLSSPSRYKDFEGSQILASATARHKPAFMREVLAKTRRLVNVRA